jgi:phosphatidate cytidylyltransferase
MALRTRTALLAAPPFLLAILVGSPLLDIVVVAGAAVMAWEAAYMAWPERGQHPAVAAGLGMGLAMLCLSLGRLDVAAVVLVGVSVAVLNSYRRRRGPYLALAMVYIGAACLAFLWLRDHPGIGLGLIVWLVGVVWATDVGALFAGRAIGGVRLAPRLSPNKTVAGLAGGVAAAALAAAALGAGLPELGAGLPWPGLAEAAAAGAALALAAQAGDLLESGYKRRFGAKDASHVLPGHGGVLDRADGLLGASLALGLAAFVLQGGA